MVSCVRLGWHTSGTQNGGAIRKSTRGWYDCREWYAIKEWRDFIEGSELVDSVLVEANVFLLLKDGNYFLAASCDRAPVFIQQTENIREAQLGLEHYRDNLSHYVFATVSNFRAEALELPHVEKPRKYARERAKKFGRVAEKAALIRQRRALQQRQRAEASERPIIDDHLWRIDLIRRSLTALADIRAEHKRKYRYGKSPAITQKDVARRVYKDSRLESAAVQFNREWKATGIPFERLLAVNKTWDELTFEERSNLNCPEVINRKLRKLPQKRK